MYNNQSDAMQDRQVAEMHQKRRKRMGASDEKVEESTNSTDRQID